MIKFTSRFLLLISLLSLVSCTITRRKYTGGFYVNWHKKALDAAVSKQAKTLPAVRNKITHSISPQPTRQAAPQRPVKSKFSSVINNISSTYTHYASPNATMQVKVNNPSLATVADKEGSTSGYSAAARFRDNGLTGFEMSLLSLVSLICLILFGHIGYAVFVLGFLLITVFLVVMSLIYDFVGLNKTDKHRGLAFIGVLIDVGVIIGLIIV